MNTLKSTFAFTITSLALLFASASQAAPIYVFENGLLAGAKDVEVNGSLYDVDFMHGHCDDIFNGCDNAAEDFFFTTQEDATAATQALFDTVFIDSSAGNFFSDPTLIKGTTSLAVTSFVTPFDLTTNADGYTWVNIMSAYWSVEHNYDYVLHYGLPTDTMSGYNTWVIWSDADSTEVPAPATLALIALGLAGLGATRRKCSYAA